MSSQTDEFSNAFSTAFDATPDPVAGDFPCSWPVDTGCFGEDWDSYSDAVRERSIALASATLRRLTGYRVGVCPITVRPCKAGCAGSTRPSYLDMMGLYGASGFYPHIEGGVWVNSCGCTHDCSCSALCEIALPGPVGRVDEVRLDGVVVPPDQYLVTSGGILWTGGGDCPWPTCQDLTLADTEVGTFSITYLNAWPVDALGAYAAGVLANEFAKACTGGKCRLPLGVTSIARQGVSYEIASGAFPGGVTGIREVDTYLALWNPTPIRQQPKVWSPDLRSPRVVR